MFQYTAERRKMRKEEILAGLLYDFGYNFRKSLTECERFRVRLYCTRKSLPLRLLAVPLIRLLSAPHRIGCAGL